jgi:uncharacterized protein (DUF1330 family)
MAKGYWVVSLEITNPEAYRAYQDFVRPFLAANDGRFVLTGGQQDVVEGAMKPRVVVIEFPSYEHAARVYHSEAYQTGLKLRLSASMADFAIVEGFDAP